MRSSNVLVVMLIMLIIITVSLPAQETKKNELPAYLLTILVGYGSGHFYLGANNAASFLLWDVVGLAVEIGGASYVYMSLINPDLEGVSTGTLVMYAGVAIIAATRIYEIVNLITTIDRMKTEGKIVSLRPIVKPTANGVSIALSFSY